MGPGGTADHSLIKPPRNIFDRKPASATAFPDLQVLLDDASAQGDGVVYSWTLIGTNTTPGGTGQPVRISGFEMWSIGEDGLIAQSQGHYDSAAYRRQLEHGVQPEGN